MDHTVHGVLQARILEWVAFPSRGDVLNPEIEPRSPALQVDSLPAETPGKPKNTGVGCLSLPQWIFPTQGSNWGLLHRRWILYQLSYQGSLITIWIGFAKPQFPHLINEDMITMFLTSSVAFFKNYLFICLHGS